MTGRIPREFGKRDPFAAAIRTTRMPAMITAPRQTDNPIVFANHVFLNLTGYGAAQPPQHRHHVHLAGIGDDHGLRR